MRYALTALLLAGLLTGCNKQSNGPQTTEAGPPRRSLDSLSPQTLPSDEAPAPTADREPTAPRPRVVQPPPEATAEAQPPESGAPPQPGPQMRVYTVQKGDTLWSIADRLLGSGRRWKEIVEMNPGLDPRNLRIGQTLRIPGS